MPRAPSTFPFFGAPQAPGDKPTPSKDDWNLGGGRNPWGQRYLQCRATPDRTAQHDTASRNVTQTPESHVWKTRRYLSYAPPCTSVAQGRLLGGFGRWAEAHTRPAVPKMPRTPSAFPLFSGRLRHQAIKPNPSEGVKAWGDGPLRPEVSPVCRSTPDQTAHYDTESHAWKTRQHVLNACLSCIKAEFKSL